MITSSCDNALFNNITENIKVINDSVNEAAVKSGRNPEDVRLMAVTKTVSVDKKQDVSDANNSGFVPVALAENPANISSSEAKSGVEYKNIDNNSKNNESSGSVELDVLPDLQELQNIQEMTSSKDVQEAPSVESTGFVVEDAKKAVSEANADSKDAALMAKAISTLLSKE